MAMVLRDPFLAEPFRLMDQLFGRVLRNGSTVTGWVPTLDLFETDDEYLVYVDLPGVKSQDV
jgi:HSP20 family molecular chaperone IbpA